VPKRINVWPYGGLCNRLRVVASARTLADVTGAKLNVGWNLDSGISAKPEDLFTNFYENMSKIYFPNIRIKWGKRFKRRNINYFYNNTRTNIISDNYLISNNFVVPSTLLDGGVVCIEACHDFLVAGLSYRKYNTRVSNFLSDLKPTQEIYERMPKLSEETIGFHIRRGDNIVSVQTSPTAAFRAIMEEMINSNYKVFLATDDEQISREFQHEWPNNVIQIHNKCFERGTLRGDKDALADLLLLSRCCKIFGSYFSSFSEYASMIRLVPLFFVNRGPWPGAAEAITTRLENWKKIDQIWKWTAT
jgi:hypothetical protein